MRISCSTNVSPKGEESKCSVNPFPYGREATYDVASELSTCAAQADAGHLDVT